MANFLMHKTETLDALECGTAAELLACVENMGMALDLARPVTVSLIEETLSDGSKAQSILITEEK